MKLQPQACGPDEMLGELQLIQRMNTSDLELPTPQDYGVEAELDFKDQALLEEDQKLDLKADAIRYERDDIPKTDPKDRKIFVRIKMALAGIAIALLSFSAVISAAGRVLIETQSAFMAVFWVIIFAMLGFGLEAHAEKLSSDRTKVDRIIAWLFVACGLTYLISFAADFAANQGIDLNSTAIGAFDHRFFFIAQILTESFLTYGFVAKIKQWLENLRTHTVDKRWLEYDDQLTSIDKRKKEIKEERANIAYDRATFNARKARIQALNEQVRKFLQSQ